MHTIQAKQNSIRIRRCPTNRRDTRNYELRGILDKVLVIDPQRAIAKIGRFEALGNASLPKGVLRPLQVEWTDPQTKKSDKTIHSKDELTKAFPSALRKDVLSALSVLSENRYSSRRQAFSVHVGSELLSIPSRIYFDPPVLQAMRLTRLESEILDCLLTRHHDGFVRQKHLSRIIRSQNAWVPCFVFPLVGEYVVEILRVIQENLTYLETSRYADFVRANPDFLNLTEQRVVSYWDCYYRSIQKESYPGFLILDFLKSTAKDTTRYLRHSIRHTSEGGIMVGFEVTAKEIRHKRCPRYRRSARLSGRSAKTATSCVRRSGLRSCQSRWHEQIGDPTLADGILDRAGPQRPPR